MDDSPKGKHLLKVIYEVLQHQMLTNDVYKSRAINVSKLLEEKKSLHPDFHSVPLLSRGIKTYSRPFSGASTFNSCKKWGLKAPFIRFFFLKHFPRFEIQLSVRENPTNQSLTHLHTLETVRLLFLPP